MLFILRLRRAAPRRIVATIAAKRSSVAKDLLPMYHWECANRGCALLREMKMATHFLFLLDRMRDIMSSYAGTSLALLGEMKT